MTEPTCTHSQPCTCEMVEWIEQMCWDRAFAWQLYEGAQDERVRVAAQNKWSELWSVEQAVERLRG